MYMIFDLIIDFLIERIIAYWMIHEEKSMDRPIMSL